MLGDAERSESRDGDFASDLADRRERLEAAVEGRAVPRADGCTELAVKTDGCTEPAVEKCATELSPHATECSAIESAAEAGRVNAVNAVAAPAGWCASAGAARSAWRMGALAAETPVSAGKVPTDAEPESGRSSLARGRGCLDGWPAISPAGAVSHVVSGERRSRT